MTVTPLSLLSALFTGLVAFLISVPFGRRVRPSSPISQGSCRAPMLPDTEKNVSSLPLHR